MSSLYGFSPCYYLAHDRNKAVLEINYGVIATVATAAMIRCYTRFVRGPEPKSVNMEGKVRRIMYLRKA